MAKVGAQRAAELTGRSKSTIQRAMNAGKLSFEVDNNGRRVIDASELDRVFGLLPQDTTAKTSNTTVQAEIQKAADLIETERLKMRIKALEEQIELLKEQLEDTKAQRDQWQRQSQQVLLTSQYSQKQAEDLKAELQAREEREQARRQQYLAERMKRMQGQGHNQNAQNGAARPQQKQAQGQNQKAAQNSGAFKGLWEKIKGKETQKAA
jgi:septum formation inhibitor MinC